MATITQATVVETVTTVAHRKCDLVLTALGFVANCAPCEWTGEMRHGKYRARSDAIAHVCQDATEPGYVSARGGKWHRATVTEPTFMHEEATGCGLTFVPLNVTWYGQRPKGSGHHMCQRPGCWGT